MKAVEAARAEARARKLAVLEYLRRHGEASLAEIMGAVGCDEQQASAALMRLTRADVVRNTNASRDKKREQARYELWEHAVARMRGRPQPNIRGWREEPLRGQKVA